VQPVVAPLVRDVPDLGRIGVDAARAVLDHGIVRPTVLPQAVAQAAVLVGHRVALVVLRQTGQTEAARGAVEIRGHDVPRDPATGQVVERADEAREDVGVVLQHRTGETEAEVFGHRGHRRDQEHRIVDRDLRRRSHRRVAAAAVDVVAADHVGQEHGVEATLLDQPRETRPLREIGVVDHAIVRPHPQTWRLVHDAVHVERVEDHARAGREAHRAIPRDRRRARLTPPGWRARPARAAAAPAGA
jgi:hypothetical protein